MNASSLRFFINAIEVLYEEYSYQDVFHQNTQMSKTVWGAQEFAFYDLDMNGLTFYRNL